MPESSHPCLAGPGAARAALRAIDWGTNSLGPPEGWPVALHVSAQMMLASSFPAAIFWGERMITLHNDAFTPILGAKPAAQGRPFYDVWAEAWDEIGPIAARAFAGEASYFADFPLTIDRHGYPEPCNFTFCYSPIRDAEGRVGGVMDTVVETTDKVLAERALELRNTELAHRLKNTLAVVSVIARQTLRAAADTAEAWEKLSARLGALAAAHHILTSGAQVAAPLADLVGTALASQAALAEGRIALSGPPVALEARQALAVALIVSELATNATKHGALSVPEGRVALDWQVTGDATARALCLDWVESGGPPVTAPSRQGFGSLLIGRVAPLDFGGTAETRFAAAGLHYRLTGPLAL
ncbi:sensor histidine kinase [Frigidibacter sp. MR17.24]|uniref:sensor histidine kinase n=1 Tax=Frigidibacter sp. MR17.24 TaxID=3127345 RepID=UPI0030129FC7